MNKRGFTLLEVLTVVIIIGILASVALPMYKRAIERSRATEAMTVIKSLNDSIYAYYADKESCPTSFKKLVTSLPGVTGTNNNIIRAKHFTFTMSAEVNVPGTSCPGVKAVRNSGGYGYAIWNPYQSYAGKALSLRCTGTAEKDVAICESFGWYENTQESN